MAATGADVSIIFVPAPFAKDAMLEAADAGIKLIVCITEGVPVIGTVEAQHYIRLRGAKLVGFNCQDSSRPKRAWWASCLPTSSRRDTRAWYPRSGTLTYEVDNLTRAGMGQTTAVGVGGDPVVGIYFEDMLQLFQDDPETDSIVLIGEIGGDAEERAAAYIKANITKPVVAFIDGREAPPGKQIGHAGAIISSGSGTAEEKIAAFRAAGVPVAMETCEIPGMIAEMLKK